jgi:hypothetical protein
MVGPLPGEDARSSEMFDWAKQTSKLMNQRQIAVVIMLAIVLFLLVAAVVARLVIVTVTDWEGGIQCAPSNQRA